MEEAKRYAKNFGFYQKGGLPLMEFGEGSNPFGARAKAFKEDSLAANVSYPDFVEFSIEI